MTVGLAKWLHLHQRKTWEELGRPGTTFFKGDEDNRYFARTTALLQFNRMRPEALKKLPRCETVDEMLRRYRWWGRLSTITFAVFGALIFWFAWTDSRPSRGLPHP